jgi:hypothetical protein
MQTIGAYPPRHAFRYEPRASHTAARWWGDFISTSSSPRILGTLCALRRVVRCVHRHANERRDDHAANRSAHADPRGRLSRGRRARLRRVGPADRLLPPRRQPPLHRRVPRLAGGVADHPPGAPLLRGGGAGRQHRLRDRPWPRAAALRAIRLAPLPPRASGARRGLLRAARRQGDRPRALRPGGAHLRPGRRRGGRDAVPAVHRLQRPRWVPLGGGGCRGRVLPRQRYPGRRSLSPADPAAWEWRRAHRSAQESAAGAEAAPAD